MPTKHTHNVKERNIPKITTASSGEWKRPIFNVSINKTRRTMLNMPHTQATFLPEHPVWFSQHIFSRFKKGKKENGKRKKRENMTSRRLFGKKNGTDNTKGFKEQVWFILFSSSNPLPLLSFLFQRPFGFVCCAWSRGPCAPK